MPILATKKLYPGHISKSKKRCCPDLGVQRDTYVTLIRTLEGRVVRNWRPAGPEVKGRIPTRSAATAGPQLFLPGHVQRPGQHTLDKKAKSEKNAKISKKIGPN